MKLHETRNERAADVRQQCTMLNKFNDCFGREWSVYRAPWTQINCRYDIVKQLPTVRAHKTLELHAKYHRSTDSLVCFSRLCVFHKYPKNFGILIITIVRFLYFCSSRWL